jgi:hypothetical protein
VVCSGPSRPFTGTFQGVVCGANCLGLLKMTVPAAGLHYKVPALVAPARVAQYHGTAIRLVSAVIEQLAIREWLRVVPRIVPVKRGIPQFGGSRARDVMALVRRSAIFLSPSSSSAVPGACGATITKQTSKDTACWNVAYSRTQLTALTDIRRATCRSCRLY